MAGLVLGACILGVAGWLGYGALKSHLLWELRAEMAGKDETTDPAPSPASPAPATASSLPPPVSQPAPPERDWSAVERGTFAALPAADRDAALAVARRLAERGEVTDEDIVRAELRGQWGVSAPRRT